MTVTEIIVNALTLLGETELNKYLNDETYRNSLTSEQTAKFSAQVDEYRRLLNTLLNELACTYLPLCKTEEISGEIIYYSALSETPLKILGVLGVDKLPMNFVIHPEYVLAKGEAKYIVYEFAPAEYELSDTIGYKQRDISKSALSFGLLAEICLYHGRFKESVSWRERFICQVQKKVVSRGGVIKPRRFL